MNPFCQAVVDFQKDSREEIDLPVDVFVACLKCSGELEEIKPGKSYCCRTCNLEVRFKTEQALPGWYTQEREGTYELLPHCETCNRKMQLDIILPKDGICKRSPLERVPFQSVFLQFFCDEDRHGVYAYPRLIKTKEKYETYIKQWRVKEAEGSIDYAFLHGFTAEAAKYMQNSRDLAEGVVETDMSHLNEENFQKAMFFYDHGVKYGLYKSVEVRGRIVVVTMDPEVFKHLDELISKKLPSA